MVEGLNCTYSPKVNEEDVAHYKIVECITSLNCYDLNALPKVSEAFKS